MYVNEKGEEVIKPQYYFLSNFNELGIADFVRKGNLHGRAGLVNTKGKEFKTFFVPFITENFMMRDIVGMETVTLKIYKKYMEHKKKGERKEISR